MSAGTLAVRARIAGRPEAPYDRLHDALTRDLLERGPVSRERFARTWTSDDDVRALAQSKRRPLDPALARAMTAYHQRLGAGPGSLANLELLARGEAVAAVAGQQPAPLGGPLYSLHKTASTVGLARTIHARTGIAAVPLFWMHGEDSDFAEIRHASVADGALAVHDFALPDDAHATGGLVGDVALAPLAALSAEALARWAGLPGQGEAAVLLERAHRGARDLGEATSALLMALFADAGLVVVDPRLPEFRSAARGVIERYLGNAAALQSAASAAGARLQQLCDKHPLNDASLESFVFEIEGGRRTKISAAGALARGAAVTLSPSVALRPAVQDGVFPTVAMAVGPGEIAYLAQLREVFEGVGVEPALLVPRFGATWLPPDAIGLLEASRAEPWRVVAETDAVLAQYAGEHVPAALEQELLGARSAALDGLTRFAEASRTLDGSLPQMVESARGKVDYQFARLHEGLVGKVRSKIDKEHPAWRRLRYVLLPGDKLQERRLASLEPVARRGGAVVGELCDAATEHAAKAAAGVHEHWLLEG
ncbi:MAG: bacillithiol biosynthesis BshC [Candidatus Eisenbacteria bacterium]|nr:bacillithiol biosynthesis BshC [Candidatus Eisenbacteria bacterium]